MTEATAGEEPLPHVPTPARPTPPPTMAEIVRSALDGLVASASELRVLSVSVALFATFVVGLPLGSVLLYSFVSWDPSVAGAPSFEIELVLPAFVALAVGSVGFLILIVQVPLYIIAAVGGRLAGQPLTLRQSLRRARQVFLRGVGAAFLIGLAAGIPANIAQEFIGGLLGPTELALGLGLLATVAFSAPWVYVLPGIVLGGVGTGEAMRRSWQLARFRGRLALTIALLAVVGQVIVIVAALAAAEAVLTVGGFADLGLDVPPSAEPLLGVAIFFIGIVILASIVFAIQVVQFAPQATGFYALTRYAAGLDAARGGPPEPLFHRPVLVFYGAGVVSALVILVAVVNKGVGP